MNLVRYWLPVFLWASLIFIGSSIPAVRVSEDGVVDFIYHKAAHLVEYAILYLLLYRALVGGKKIWDGKKMVISLLLTTFYGAGDEVHQLFTPGRSPRLRDILVDFAGASVGALVWKFFLKAKKKL